MTTAQTEYQARQARIQALMQQLQATLVCHSQQAATKPSDYGFLGDLGHVEMGLQQLVDFFQN